MTYQQILNSNSNHPPSSEEGVYGNEVKPSRNQTSESINTVPKYSTKAGTLRFLKDRLRSAAIADLYSFTVAAWETDREACLSEINKLFSSSPLIVRSSCKREDNLLTSNAGAFLSKLHVGPLDIQKSIEEVIASYGDCDDSDEVLIQPMLQDVVASGVAFSHDPSTSSPYRIINWAEGKDTSAITGGENGRVWYQAATAKNNHPKLSPVVTLMEELLSIFGDIPVDCEFALTKERGKEKLWLLQARPLLLKSESLSNERQATLLSTIERKVTEGMQPHPFVLGQKTIYGVMPDWNPAEIIGVRPKPLALSLYRDLITDSIWAYQRHNYGYRNLRSFPLMTNFFGLPYIDARLSFNSFIPASLNDEVAERLANHYLQTLSKQPYLHDKIEFEIVHSCYTFDLEKKLSLLREGAFCLADTDEISSALLSLTNNIIHPDRGLWKKDAQKLAILTERRQQLYASTLSLPGKIYWLLEDAKRYGTLPFAGLARAGFVAVQMLQSLVQMGVFSKNEYHLFLESICTINKKMSRDRARSTKNDFLQKYGHLRPGTYDVLSPRYDEAPDLYFNWKEKPINAVGDETFSPSNQQLKQIDNLIEQHGLATDATSLIEFIQSGIEMRELGKFEFSKNLSDCLSLITQFSCEIGVPIDEMAFCDINAIKELHLSSGAYKSSILESIQHGKSVYQDTQSVSLPPLITSPDQVWAFEVPSTEPNFITQKQITAPIVDANACHELKGKIVCIPSADPGFDWLFSQDIAGLITTWGGANSHMAIRSGELGLPAVIGAGELLYKKCLSADLLLLDCAGRRVEAVR